MSPIKSLHHIAIICSKYTVSKKFYTEILGLRIIKEIYRKERNSYKLDLSLNNQYIIELFSFPNPKKRPTLPESAGLRHIAFQVENIEKAIVYFNSLNIETEDIRIDEFTQKRFTFLRDPDNLPIELYEE